MSNRIERFAKTFIVDGHQVLVEKDYNTEEEKPEIRIVTEFEDCKGSIKFGFASEERQNEVFENFNDETARDFLKYLADPEALANLFQ